MTTEKPGEGKALNDRAMSSLCWLIEQPIPRLAPDAVQACGDVYRHLREIEFLTLSNELVGSILCRECGTELIQPTAADMANTESHPYQGCCPDCGWIPLAAEDARWWQAQPVKIARWLNSALRLSPHYRVETIIDGKLWRLGEREFNRRRYGMFFGRQLAASAQQVGDALANLAASGTEIIITASDVQALQGTVLQDRTIVPLRSVAHLRKGGLVVENIETFIPSMCPVEAFGETSLRKLDNRIALIDGRPIHLSPQVQGFLQVLLDADGDEVAKYRIAEHLRIEPNFKLANIFKRHKSVLDTFVDYNRKGYFWLKPEFILLERG